MGRAGGGIDPDAASRRLASQSLGAGDATGWFERLYIAAARGSAVVPWDRGAPHPLLLEWLGSRQPDETPPKHERPHRAVVVGCGLGQDAEAVAAHGFVTTAFDVAPSAVAAARTRFPESSVRYVVADLLDRPAEWAQGFDLVVESLTVQALPRSLRAEAVAAVAGLVASGGTLLVIGAVADEAQAADDAGSGPPWPLTRQELASFADHGLQPVRVEDLRDTARPDVGRWRAEFGRP